MMRLHVRVVLIVFTLLSAVDVVNASKRSRNHTSSKSTSQTSEVKNKSTKKPNGGKLKLDDEKTSPPLFPNGRRIRIIGTRITGVGSHSRTSRSIFKPHKKESGPLSKITIMGKDRRFDNSDAWGCESSLKGKMFTKLSHDGKLLFFFPSSSNEGNDPNDDSTTLDGKIISLSYTRDVEDKNPDDKIHAEFVDKSDEILKKGESLKPWIPIEGIFGVYLLPSGPHLVLINETEQIYKINGGGGTDGNVDSDASLIDIRRILSMEIVRLPQQGGKRHRHRLHNEKRQFHVLRQSLKEHEFYYVPRPSELGNKQEESIVQDITHNLQRSFVHWATERGRIQNISNEKGDDPDMKWVGMERNDAENPDVSSENETKEDVLDVDETKNILDSSTVPEPNVSDQSNSTKIIGSETLGEGQNWWGRLSSKVQSKSDDEEETEESSEGCTPPEEFVQEDEMDNHTNSNDMALRGDIHDEKLGKSWWTAIVNCHDPEYMHRVQRPDSRFFWNEDFIHPFLRSLERCNGEDSSSPYKTILDHAIPVTSAFIGVQKDITLVPNAKSNAAYGVTYDQLLISRRSKYRAGTRFTRRGADATGDVANFAETEQICIIHADAKTKGGCKVQELYSHTQTRGSIPIRWSSPTDIKTYRPKVMIGTDPLAQARALRSHLVEQLILYSDPMDTRSREDFNLVFINLIDKHSDQGRLGRTFSAVLDAVLSAYNDSEEKNGDIVASLINAKSVSHVWYDFHAECKGGRWDRLKYLLEDVRRSLEKQGYFCAVPKHDSNWKIKSLQNGSIRTNCMDCLDRTNVVQSMFGRYILYQQFSKRIGLSTEGKSQRTLPIKMNLAFKRNMLTLPWESGEIRHRMLWADNADAISRLYAGTPALKGDFTRTGKRTKRGALDDGMNSLTRFYLNNFIDADRQEGMDLLTGFADFDSTEGMDDSLTKKQASRNRRRKKSLGLFEERMKEIARRERFKAMTIDPRLNLTWLPGDLQSHLRSAALSSLSSSDESARILVNRSNEVSLSTALRDIDRRSMLDYPWWVTEDSSSEEEEKEPEQIATFRTSSNFAIGALVASVKAPISSAVAFICFMVPGIIRPKD